MNDNDQLLKTMSRLIDVLEKSSSSGRSVRYGRGGDSNGVAPNIAYNKMTSEKTGNKLDRAAKKSADTLGSFSDSLRRVTKINYVLGEKLDDTIDRILDTHKKTTLHTKKVTAETIELAKQFGLTSKEMRDSTGNIVRYTESVNKLTKLSQRKEGIDKAQVELAALQTRRNKLSGRNKDKAEVLAINARLKELNSIIASREGIEKEMKELGDDLAELGNEVFDTIGPFQHLSDATKDVIRNQRGLADDHRLQKKVVEELNEVSNDYLATLTELNRDELKHHEKMKGMRDSAVGAAKDVGRAYMGSFGNVINNFREQLKYNVRDSHYLSAGSMGMGDGEMSKFIGSNADVLRGASGLSNASDVVESGRMRPLHEQINRTYGLSGAEGAEVMATLMSTLQHSGINARSSATVGSHISSVAAMGDRMGIPKEEMVNIFKSLADSGDLASMAGKYSHLNADEQQKALDAELEARIKNSKMLGRTTDQMKQQLAMERNKQYAGLDAMIDSVVGGETLKVALKQYGHKPTKEESAAIDMVSVGGGTADQRALFEKLTQQASGYQITAQGAASAANNKTGLLQLAGYRSAYSDLGMPGMSNEDLQAAQASIANAKGKYMGDYDRYMAGGRASSQLEGKATSPDDYDSHLTVGDQALNVGKTYFDGIMKNPLAVTAVNTGILVGQVAGLLIQGRLARGLPALPGMGGGAGGAGAGAGGMAGAVNAAKSVGSAALKSKALRIGGGLTGVISAYGSYSDSKARHESTGNAISSGIGAGVGGGGGAWAGAAAGAALGAIGGPVGILIGGAIGAALGGWGGSVLGEKIGDGIWDGVTGEGDGPQDALDRVVAKQQTSKQALASLDPEYLRLHPEIEEAIKQAGMNSTVTAKATGEVASATRDGLNHAKTTAEAQADFRAQESRKRATHDYYRGGSVTD